MPVKQPTEQQQEMVSMLRRCSEAKDMAEWNTWREDNPTAVIDLQGLRLSGLWLQGADFRFAHCEEAIFWDAHCEKANFCEAHCEGADFSSAHCERAYFGGAHCEKAIFSSAHCKGAFFYKAHCGGADFSSAHCEKAIFAFARCEKADFSSAHCEWAIFAFARCEGADFGSARCERAEFSRAHCEEVIFNRTHCEGAYFGGAHCEGASFYSAHCQGTNFWNAHCEGASFLDTHCENAYFTGTYCNSTMFANTFLQGSHFTSVALSSNTKILTHEIDDDTDFSNSSLSSVIIEPGVRAKLEQNIRRKSWNKGHKTVSRLRGCAWARKWGVFARPCTNTLRTWKKTAAQQEAGKGAHSSTTFGKTKDCGSHALQRILLIFCALLLWARRLPYCLQYFLKNPKIACIRFFWWISDYGYSTSRVLACLAGFIVFFGLIYTAFPELLAKANTQGTLEPMQYKDCIQLLLFATATMVTLGFGNINAASTWGMFVVACNLMVGYFMLAVLVTRLGVLFQTFGPGFVPKAKVAATTSLDAEGKG